MWNFIVPKTKFKSILNRILKLVRKNNGIGLFKTFLTKYLSVLLFHYTNFQRYTAFAKKEKRGKGTFYATWKDSWEKTDWYSLLIHLWSDLILVKYFFGDRHWPFERLFWRNYYQFCSSITQIVKAAHRKFINVFNNC